MKRDCSTCICKEGSCYPSTTIFDKDKTCKSYDPDYEGYITDLEKENAELKKVKQVKIEVTRDYKKLAKDLQEQGNQLTKAKEIIKEFMKYEITEYDGSLEIHFEELKKQAEQFLNNEVEK